MKSILGIFLALALCATANAQCPGGKCQSVIKEVVKETTKVVEGAVNKTVDTTASVVHKALPPYNKKKYAIQRTRRVVVTRTVVR